MNRLAAFVLVSILLTSCSSLEQSIDSLYQEVISSSQYTVKENETLWSIALKNNVSPNKLAIRNNLKKPYLIYPGQKLLLNNLESIKLDQNISPSWKLPTKSSIRKSYEGNFWLIFNGKIGDPIFAILDGEVVLSGAVLPGYGNFIMIDHGNEYLSLYAHCDELYVKKGMKVKQGELIASLGSSETNQPKLKFQVRKLGVPIKISDLNFN